MIDVLSSFEAAWVVACARLCEITHDAEDFECFGNELTAEEFSVLSNVSLTILTCLFGFVCEEFRYSYSILLAEAVFSEIVKRIQFVWGHVEI